MEKLFYLSTQQKYTGQGYSKQTFLKDGLTTRFQFSPHLITVPCAYSNVSLQHNKVAKDRVVHDEVVQGWPK